MVCNSSGAETREIEFPPVFTVNLLSDNYFCLYLRRQYLCVIIYGSYYEKNQGQPEVCKALLD